MVKLFSKSANFIFKHGILAINEHEFTNFMPLSYFEN